MNKKLPTEDITNELARSSFFARPPASSKPAPQSPASNDKPTSDPHIAEALPPSDAPANQVSSQDSTLSRNHAITHANNHDDKQLVTQDGLIEEHLDEVRKAVKQQGKELSTHRFSAEEKTALTDIVYTYSRRGVRTSENEITRIAVNWLLVDYRQNGANSVLARMLERLHG